ncbi:MAG: 5-formyltetrahydrofolate cyclo-ligase [bacterium]
MSPGLKVTMEMTQTKETVRNMMRQRRADLDAGWVQTASRRVVERVVALPEFKRAEVICTYLSLPGEVQTKPILEAAWKAGKRVSVAALRDDGEYMPAWITPDEPLMTAKFGVRQPATLHWAKPDRYDLVIVPGLAFSVTGGRMGHGRGFYDRMLARLAARLTCRAGVCFGFQLVPDLPVTEHDGGMDVIVTEDAVIRTT